MGTIRKAIPALALALAVGAGCNDSGVSAEADGHARLSIHLTDAPGDVAAVWVEVTEIYLQGSDGRTDLLDEPTGLIELTELIGTSRTLVSDAEVDVGAYQQLRFVIGEAVLETVGGDVYVKGGAEHPDGLPTTGSLNCPSCSASGLKVVLHSAELDLDAASHDLLLDFDVSQSFGRLAGMSGQWVMRPVIHGILENAVGRVEGTVEVAMDVNGDPLFEIPQCPVGTDRGVEDFVPLAVSQSMTDDDGNPVIRTGITEADGSFGIFALGSGSYDLDFVTTVEYEGAQLNWTAEVDPTAVTVGSGQTVSGVLFTITGAACEVDG